MSQIVDVEYKEIVTFDDKSTEELATEANSLWEQMEMIGNIGLVLAAQAGHRLIIIKDRLKHGEWESWCKENLKFSCRKAGMMMNLSRKMSDENSLFSNPKTFADIEISKVYELLAAPEDIAKEVMENQNVDEISVRELKAEIKKLKEEKETAGCTISELEENIEKLSEEIKKAQQAETEAIRRAEVAEARPDPDVEQEKEIAKLKDLLKAEKEKLKKVKAGMEKVAAEAAEKAKEETVEAAKAEVQKEFNILKEEYITANEEIERLKRSIENNSDKDIAVFKVKADLLQETFNTCLESVDRISEKNEEQGLKLKTALKTVLNAMFERI